MFREFAKTIMILPAALAGAACGDTHGHDEQVPVEIRFAGEIGGKPFACDMVASGVGQPAADYTATDFRLYVSSVRLVGDGHEHAVTLDDDGVFQDGDVALLDFEDGSGGCMSGTPAKHDRVTGKVAKGTYSGIRFTVGVPFAKNHVDSAKAKPPLDTTSMFWAWQGGYKFLRVDGKAAGNTFLLHLGSTGCASSAPSEAPKTDCQNPNRMEVALDGMDPTRAVVVADAAAVLGGSDLTRNTMATAPGCMSEPSDPECAPIFQRLGLPLAGQAGGAQALFTLR